MDWPTGGTEKSPVARAMELWVRTVLPQYLLPTLCDRVELAHGVEGRPPLLDQRLARVAAALPDGDRVRGQITKWALREAARGLLPEASRLRPKQPFLGPPLAARKGALRELLYDTLTGPRARELPCFSGLRVEMMLELALDDEAVATELDPALNLVLSLALLGQELGVAS